MNLLPQPTDLLPEATVKMLEFLHLCSDSFYHPTPEEEPLLRFVYVALCVLKAHRLKKNAAIQSTVSEWKSIPHYVAAQLLCCRFEELKELFWSFNILFCGSRMIFSKHSNCFTNRDYHVARANYVPNVFPPCSVEQSKSNSHNVVYSTQFTVPSVRFNKCSHLPSLAVELPLGKMLEGRVVAIFCSCRTEASTREQPLPPDNILYGFVLNIRQSPNKDVLVQIGFPSFNSVQLLSQCLWQCSNVDLLFLSSTLHTTLWPRLISLTRLLPLADRPVDCQMFQTCQLPEATFQQNLCAWLTVISMATGSDDTSGGLLPSLTKRKKPSSLLQEAQKFCVAHTMDETQTTAFLGMNYSPIALIQGIPGSGKTFVAQKAAEFRLKYNLNDTVLVGSYKNVSTDHLCEEANQHPEEVCSTCSCFS